MIDAEPLRFTFRHGNQPDDSRWQMIIALATDWNSTHEIELTQPKETEWSISIADGIDSSLVAELDARLEELSARGVVYSKGVVDMRRPADYEQADFVEIVGDNYPAGFAPNLAQVVGEAANCGQCGRSILYGQPILGTLVVDEGFLDRQIHPAPQYQPPGLDIIHLVNGVVMCSARVVRLLESLGIQGYELSPVTSLATGKASERVFLLRAKKAVLTPCPIHTPSPPGSICPGCGHISNGIWRRFRVRTDWLEGDEFFSRNPLCHCRFNVSKRLYQAMKAEGLRGLLPAFGIFACTHHASDGSDIGA